MTLKSAIDRFQREINCCLETTEYLYQSCDRIQDCPPEELSRFFQQLQELCEELDRQLSQIGDNLLEINCKWGDATIEHYRVSARSNSSGIIKLVNSLQKLTPIDIQTKNLKSPRLIEGQSQKLKKNLIAKGIQYKEGYQAHHIIPSSVADKSELMLNAIEKAGFDIDCGDNGIFLPKNISDYELLPSHRGSHPNYSNYAEDVLKHKWDELKQSGLQNDKIALISSVNDTIKHLKEVIEQMRSTINDI
jgi:hypothetical protein